MKRALITGITGQDGSYLADLLLEKGYEVHGIIRRASTFNTSRIDHLYADPHVNDVRMFLHYGDLSDSVNLVKLLYKLKPDEIYHLGAQSHVRVSFDIPEYTSDVTGVGTIRILEAIREAGLRSRFLQASSSEIFVSRKISRAVAAIKQGVQKELFLGNLDAKRDWGYAPEYVEGMWRIVQLDEGDDFVLATGESHSVREFAEAAFAHVDLDWKKYVKHDPRYERPAEVDLLVGNAAKAKKVLGWEPKVRFHELVQIMVDADMELLSRKTPQEHLGKLP